MHKRNETSKTIQRANIWIFSTLFLCVSHLVSAGNECSTLPRKVEVCKGSSVRLCAEDNIFTQADFSLSFENKTYLKTGINPLLNPKSGNLSISLWVKPTEIKGRRVLLSKPMDDVNLFGTYSLYLQDGYPRFFIRLHGGLTRASVLASSLQPLKSEQWYHIAVVCNADSGKVELLINGQKKASQSWSGRFHQAKDYPLWIGAHYTASKKEHDYFSGLIDEVKMWDKVASIKDMVQRTTPASEMLLCYTFKEGSEKTVIDNSPNKIHSNVINGNIAGEIPSIFRQSKVSYHWLSGDTTPTVNIKPQKSGWQRVTISQLKTFYTDSVWLEVVPNDYFINGKSKVKRNTIEEYSVENHAGSLYRWSIGGGQIMSGEGTNKIIVKWSKAKKGGISVQETTKNGCIGSLINLVTEITK